MDETQAQPGAFNPGAYITKVNGGDYLEVKWRLVWFRSEHPDGLVETEHVEISQHRAVFKATISLKNNGGATGYGSESAEDFGDFIEKAETKAIGRALAALGYGTQFCPEFADGPSQRIADSPVNRGGQPSGPRPAGGSSQPATEKQIRFLYTLSRGSGWNDEQLGTFTQENYGTAPKALTKADASALIDYIQSGGKPLSTDSQVSDQSIPREEPAPASAQTASQTAGLLTDAQKRYLERMADAMVEQAKAAGQTWMLSVWIDENYETEIQRLTTAQATDAIEKLKGMTDKRPASRAADPGDTLPF